MGTTIDKDKVRFHIMRTGTHVLTLPSAMEPLMSTPLSRLLGKPPIMVAGMTSSTVKAGFASVVFPADYCIELAGGGHYNPATLRSKVAEIQANVPAGVGITLMPVA